MSVEITSVSDNYFSAGLDSYSGVTGVNGLLPAGATTGVNTSYDYINGNNATFDSNAVIDIRRRNLGLTYDRGILIPYSYDSSAILSYYNFFPRIVVVADEAYKIKCTARIKVLKASYDVSPIAMKVSIGLAGSDVPTAVDKIALVHANEDWVDLTIIARCTGAGGTINFKIGNFEILNDCLLLCDYWTAEITE